MVHDLLENFQNAARVLVRHDRDDADQRCEGEGFGDRGRGSPGAVWVVCRVEYHSRRAAYELQSARKPDLGESLADHIGMQRLEPEKGLRRSERLASVCCLVRTVQGQEDVIHRAVRAVESNYLSCHGETPIDDTEVNALPLRQCAHLGAPSEQHLGRLDTLPGLMIPAFSRAISVTVRPSK